MRFLYSILWTLILPLALLRLFWRSRREAGYAVNVLQRLGLFGAVTRQSTIWLHAVSVGETRAAGPLIARLRDCYPDRRILLTQTTATGRATAQSLYGDSVTLAWLPWDLPWSQHAFLRAWRPDVGILMETELWPNLILQANFADRTTANHGVPYSWLASYGYTNEFETAEALIGENEYPVWQSCLAGLNPTNAASQLRGEGTCIN